MLIYTSGTTAQPKGVLHTQRAAVLQSWRFAEILRLDARGPRLHHAIPSSGRPASRCRSARRSRRARRCCSQEVFEPGAALALIEARARDGRARLAAPAEGAGRASRRRRSAICAACARSTSARRSRSSPGIEKDDYGTGASYGLSETFTIAAMLPADAPLELRKRTSGRALPGMALRIVDPATGAPLADGRRRRDRREGRDADARLLQGGARDTSSTPTATSARRTAARSTQSGYLHWTGRLSSLIKTGGANVSPVEIEECLAKHPGAQGRASPSASSIRRSARSSCCARCPSRARASTRRERARAGCASASPPTRCRSACCSSAPDELAYTGNQKVQVAPLRRRRCAPARTARRDPGVLL